MSEGKIQLGITNIQNLQLQQRQVVTQTQLITARLFEWPSEYLDAFLQDVFDEYFMVEGRVPVTGAGGNDGGGNGKSPDKEELLKLLRDVVKIKRGTGFTSYSDDEFDYMSNVSEEESFHDYIMREFLANVKNKREEIIGTVIINNLDDRGFLRESDGSGWGEVVNYIIENSSSLGLDPPPTEEEMEGVLKIIQSLDPPGVGSRSNIEFLLAQLENSEIEGEGVNAARKMLFTFKDNDNFLAELIESGNIGEIAWHAGLDKKEVEEALKTIRKLAPSPISLIKTRRVRATFSYDDTNIIKPVAVVRISRQIIKEHGIERVIEEPMAEVEWNYSNQFIVNEDAFKTLIETFKNNPDLQKEYKDIYTKVNEVRKVLMYADNVISSIVKLVVEKQKDYFLTGNESSLKPLTMKELADEIGRDPSTVSRALQGKYIETPWGEVIEFSKLFPRTDNKILMIIKELIENEPPDRPYTDSRLEHILNMKGFKIARRTVQKYRDMLGIPKASERKKRKKKG